MNFGCLSDSLDENGAGLSPDDLSRHVYILGSTGCGKSTLIRNLYKHLECANHTGVLANSSIYIDIKDEDSKLLLRQCEKKTTENDNITYLDINESYFGVNLLELPKYNTTERDTIVSRMVGHIVEMFREFYTNSKTFIQMERILRLLLFYLYSNTDEPTMLDLYSVITRLQSDGVRELQRILQIYKKITGPEMENALMSISKLPKESWIPLLNRIEMFATDNYLKMKFGIVHSTINFEKMLEPGNITIFRLSDTETPKYAHSLILMAIVIKIWFMIQHRASKIASDKRSLVVLTLDEFQRIKDLSVLTSILSQARAYNLGLILSHQNLAQIDTELLETIVGNTATQVYGRVSGIDASRIARIIDPHFAEELTDQLAVQADFIFTEKTRPPPGQPQGFPFQFKALPPPPLLFDENETSELLEKMKKQYKSNDILQSPLDLAISKKTEWMKQLQLKFYSKEEFDIMRFLRNHEANLTKIVEAIGS
ncbi:MAG TPA: TraM recognition domain-containing protein, partial [Candidatus Nitrosotenuis sp.]|nr:TraM recognition domain-containing protein [Candidatus Nitrosotenuis sp.]